MIKDDFLFCENIIRYHSSSFYKAFRTLNEEKANAVYAVYAFCRMADDIVDEGGDDDALDAFYHELSQFENGNTPDKPLWRALRHVFNNFDMDIKPFYEMLEGQRGDSQFKPIKTDEELLHYCYLVAGTVSLMLLPILSSNPKQDLRQTGVALGQAMQLTNILRDIGEDLKRGRIYLSQEAMNRFGVTEDDLKQGNIHKNFIALWEHYGKMAEALYHKGLKNLEAYDPDARLPLLLASDYYGRILTRIRKEKYAVFQDRIYLSDLEKAYIYLKYKLGFNRLKSKKAVG